MTDQIVLIFVQQYESSPFVVPNSGGHGHPNTIAWRIEVDSKWSLYSSTRWYTTNVYHFFSVADRLNLATLAWVLQDTRCNSYDRAGSADGPTTAMTDVMSRSHVVLYALSAVACGSVWTWVRHSIGEVAVLSESTANANATR